MSQWHNDQSGQPDNQAGYARPQYSEQQYPQPYQGQYPVQAGYGPPPAYGAPPGYGYPPPVVVPQASNGIGTAGFVCGLLGLILFWIPIVGLVLGVLGVIMGGAGISAGNKYGARTGLAVAGLVLGIIALIPGLLIFVAVIST
jgi:hypothetical protein